MTITKDDIENLRETIGKLEIRCTCKQPDHYCENCEYTTDIEGILDDFISENFSLHGEEE